VDLLGVSRCSGEGIVALLHLDELSSMITVDLGLQGTQSEVCIWTCSHWGVQVPLSLNRLGAWA
jgi:hypothetical protein